jgi:hypothetical protein
MHCGMKGEIEYDSEEEERKEGDEAGHANEFESDGRKGVQGSMGGSASEKAFSGTGAQDKKKKRAKSSKPKGGLTAAQKAKKEQEKQMKDLHSTTRWLPDSAFTTYFGKPAFHAYGKGNTKPTVGGTVYGQYMLSHSVNPESGNNDPKF